MKYCAKCGQKMSDDAMRCSACHRFSELFWLTLFNSVGWVVFLALVYGVFARLVPALATILASALMPISEGWLYQIQASNVIVTFGRIFADLAAVLVLAAAVASREFPRFRKVLAPFLCIGLVSMTTLIFADGVSLYSLAQGFTDRSEHVAEHNTEMSALDATRRTIAAEYRYRELHPKAGFTCDFAPLQALGGPAESEIAVGKARKGFLDTGPYTLSLS